MREHQPARPGVAGDEAGVAGSHVAVIGRLGLLGREIGRFADEQIGPLGERDGVVTTPRIHHERERLPRPVHADLVEVHGLSFHVDRPARDELLDAAPHHARCRQALGHHGAAVGLVQAIAVRVDAVIEAPSRELEGRARVDHAFVGHRARRDAADVVVDRRVAHPVEIDLARGGKMHLDLVRHPVEADALREPGEAQTMVAVEVRNEDARDLRDRDASVDHLPLRALARVEQQPFVVPAQQVTVVIAVPGGHLAARAEDDQLTCGHGRLRAIATCPYG
jgi:hypothetical protein